MRWSWDELMSTPSWVVERVRLVLDVQEAWREQEQKKHGSG